jgi:dCMP deaminase
MRPSKDTYFLKMAYLVSSRSTCDRKHVGAVIVDEYGRIVATGYNGAPSGAPHCDDQGHEIVEGHCIRTIHGESNAIDFAGREARGCTLYVTVTPCYDCAKRIANTGIKRLVYAEHYESRYGRSSTVPEWLRSLGIQVDHVQNPAVQAMRDFLDGKDK